VRVEVSCVGAKIGGDVDLLAAIDACIAENEPADSSAPPDEAATQAGDEPEATDGDNSGGRDEILVYAGEGSFIDDLPSGDDEVTCRGSADITLEIHPNDVVVATVTQTVFSNAFTGECVTGSDTYQGAGTVDGAGTFFFQFYDVVVTGTFDTTHAVGSGFGYLVQGSNECRCFTVEFDVPSG
jgi:hypothetical protein